VFIADEFFLQAQRRIPSRSYYRGYPQLENGIGLVRLMLDEWEALRKQFPAQRVRRRGRRLERSKKHVVATSVLAAPFMRQVVEGMVRSAGGQVEVCPVVNGLFGPSVTVAGLLAARDVVRALRGCDRTSEAVVPAAMFNADGYTLDGVSRRRLGRMLRRKVHVASDVRELYAILYQGRRSHGTKRQ
jgi:NifB/MoaA-like Fe-S oxidoreductase